MTDREKVISGLMMLADAKNDNTCEGLKCCKIAEDALELLKEQDETIKELQNAYGYLQKLFFEAQDKLLKEQETKWIHREDMDFIDKYNCTHFHGMCTNCGLVHDFIDGHTGQYLYCPQCGRSVKWE